MKVFQLLLLCPGQFVLGFIFFQLAKHLLAAGRAAEQLGLSSAHHIHLLYRLEKELMFVEGCHEERCNEQEHLHESSKVAK